MNKFVVDRPYADPKAAAREPVEITHATEACNTARAEEPKANSTAGRVSVAPHVSGVAPCATGPLMAAR